MDKKQDLLNVQRVLEGDISAFEAIVRRWQKPLINFAFRFCRDRERAEEMAQDAFMQIYRKLGKYRGDAAFSTWMFAVSLNVFRSSMRRKTLPTECMETVNEIALETQVQQRMEQRERDKWVRQAVGSLPPRYRDALIVFYFREMNLEETAGILGVSEGTLKSWLHRGRELLKRKIESENTPLAMVQEVQL